MKTIKSFFLLITSILIFTSCNKDNLEVISSEENLILNFELSNTKEVFIDKNSQKVFIIIEENQDITSLTPSIKVSDKATISPQGSQDFSTPVEYTITAQNGDKSMYTIYVSKITENSRQAETVVTSFKFTVADNPNVGLTSDAVGVIEENTSFFSKISITVPESVDITNLRSDVEIQNGFTLSTNSYRNYSNEVILYIFSNDYQLSKAYFIEVNRGNDNIVFEDDNFKQALINRSVDTNNDGEISYSEANATENLFLRGNDIKNISEIEYFTNLVGLGIMSTNIGSLDVTKNVKLENLLVSFNRNLETINIDNPNLKSVTVSSSGLLSEINLSNATNLNTVKYANLIGLKSLDLSTNKNLKEIFLYNNQLEYINLKNDTNDEITNVIIRESSTGIVTCLEVDDPTANYIQNWNLSYQGGTLNLSLNCN